MDARLQLLREKLNVMCYESALQDKSCNKQDIKDFTNLKVESLKKIKDLVEHINALPEIFGESVEENIYPTDQRIKLVVCDENILGYINPRTPCTIGIINASILKGANVGMYQTTLSVSQLYDNVRLASEKDFQDFGVVFGGFDNTGMYLYKN